ncbi:tRNA uracil 4-sulfurtransferase ThiI [Acidianus sp. HS-5]|uniref:tRNA uracil 4-sulfurtransferase ThiI n=1 Tax=Acidianus sp. HS-5 TaxID=2886040 RepID=UPI001EFF7104|nr:tRNA uracil 4-sulfurtransferase ThiI [Acidianus sp. HS-5]BDC18446.1 tRNA 4-thiouridine(8) synthase ThiI [Acidianus sp. HS-5]
MKLLIVRYDEIGVKSNIVRKKLENLLISNLRASANYFNCGEVKVEKGQGRIYLDGNVDCLKISSSKVFGVKSVSPAEKITFQSLNEITNFAEKLWSKKVDGKKFAVRVRRVGKHDFTSIEAAARIADRFQGKVDLENPEVEVFVEIRQNEAYFYDEIIKGPGGLPLGSEGKALALVSGGIDSPVASWMIMKRGVALDILHCNISGPNNLSMILKVVDKIKEWSQGYTPQVFIVDCGKIMEVIMKKVDVRLWSVAFKRALYLIATNYANRIGAKSIVTGESLGQVSSQTLSVLSGLQYKIDKLFLRPLIGFDKDDIVKLAMEIGTFELSTKVPEYCAIFSHKPRTKVSIEEIEKIDEILKEAIEDTVKESEIKKKKKEEYIVYLNKLPESLQNTIIIDLRKEEEYKKNHLPSAIRLDPWNVMDFVLKSGKDKTYILYCEKGVVSGDLAYRLKKMGYTAYALKNTMLTA